MAKIQKNLSLIESKMEKLDLAFLSKILPRLSYSNPYFLVYLSEALHEISNDMPASIKNFNTDELLDYLNKKATNLYLNSNISECLLTVM